MNNEPSPMWAKDIRNDVAAPNSNTNDSKYEKKTNNNKRWQELTKASLIFELCALVDCWFGDWSTTDTYSDSDGAMNFNFKTGGSKPHKKSRPKYNKRSMRTQSAANSCNKHNHKKWEEKGTKSRHADNDNQNKSIKNNKGINQRYTWIQRCNASFRISMDSGIIRFSTKKLSFKKIHEG